MMQLVLKFAACSRAAGLRVSTSEVLDTLDQLALINPVEEEDFKTLLRANFAKSKREQPRFDHLYDLFFHEMQTDLDSQSESVGEHLGDILDMLQQELGDDPEAMAVVDLMAGNPMAYLEMMREIQTDSEQGSGRPMNVNLGQLARRLQIMLGFNDVRELIQQFLADRTPGPGTNQTIDYQSRQQIGGYFEERLVTANIRIKDANRSIARRAVNDNTILKDWINDGVRLVKI